MRLLRVAFHLGRGVLIVQCVFPWLGAEHRRAIKRRWSARLVRILGIRLKQGTLDLPPGVLIVSNHISWIDIFVINALTETSFVCKDDVRQWPIIGWLVAHTGAVFIERGNRAAAARTAQAVTARLQAGERIVFFPEGTTTDGSTLLPFRAALFQAGCTSAGVIPFALQYLDEQGRRHPAPAYDGDISFAECMLAVVNTNDICVRALALPALPAGLDRREMAARSHHQLAIALGMKPVGAEMIDGDERDDGAAPATLQSAPGS
ncbi:MAG: lysophospholipid acyltransferase family protein [Rhodocyclaceae bacterium]